MLRSLLIALPIVLVLCSQSPAQTFVTGFAGGVRDPHNFAHMRSVYGVSGGFWSTLPIGVEVDLGLYPKFFPSAHPDGDHHVVGNIRTLAVNAILGFPMDSSDGPSVHPYVTGGLVLFQINADEPSGFFDVRGTDAGFDVGAGAIVLLNAHVGFRGDVRYLKDPRQYVCAVAHDPVHGETVAFGAFGFARITAGVVWRF